jgi:hypothetical protein
VQMIRGVALEFWQLASDPVARERILVSSLFVLDAHRNLDRMLRADRDESDYQLGKTIVLPLLRYPLKVLGASEEALRETNVHNAVARQLGVVEPYVYEVNVTVPVHGELYMNFGLLGVLLGMFMLGAMYRAIYGIATVAQGDFRGARSSMLVYFMLWYYWVFLVTYFSIGTLLVVTLAKLLMWGPLILLMRKD